VDARAVNGHRRTKSSRRDERHDVPHPPARASQAQRRAALLGAQYDEEPTRKRARLPWIGSWSLPLIVYGGAAPGMFSRSRLNDFD